MTLQKVHKNVSLAPLTTFGIGGEAQYIVDVRSEIEVREAIEWARNKDLQFVVLGGGSNVLIPDNGIQKLVIRLRGDLFGVQGGLLNSWAGANLLSVIKATGAQGWGGWEKLSGIPGTIGGAVRGNAGAFGTEIKDVVVSVAALHSESLETREFTNDDCGFSYRHSFFKDNPLWIITRVKAQLIKCEPAENMRLTEETIAERERRHLQNVRAAGSYFMNPIAPAHIVELFEKEKSVKSREGRVPAGWLIEKAGLKGATVGGAIASLQHPNYIVNQGSATEADVRELAQRIKNEVFEKFAVVLIEEAALVS